MNQHPGADRLRQWLDGRLNEADSLAIETHLATGCADCAAILDQISSGKAPGPENAESRAESAPLSPPGYEVLEEIGRGGMGVVYKARQINLDRLVALKMILPGKHAGTEDLTRFRIEAEAIARLQHPNIVQIHEVGVYDARPFFSMEYCAGGSLERQQGKVPLPPRTAAETVEILARAIHAAHGKGVVHRDLKPTNVLISADGVLKIVDFGLAKKLDVKQGDTQFGAIVGTPAYMAPEQAKSKEVGPAADIYALGVILYELLTGRPPFQQPDMVETLVQMLSEEPVPVRRLQPKVPRDLETVCLKCLQKEPARRYESAAALADDLRRFLEGRDLVARPPGRLERSVKWIKRRPAQTSLIVAVLLLGTLAGGGLWWFQRVEADRNARQVRTELAVLPELSEAKLLTEQASGLSGKPDEWETTLKLALGTINRASALVDTGEATAALRDDVARVRQELEAAERERLLIRDLDDIQLRLSDQDAGHSDRAGAVALYVDAFRRNGGIDLFALEPAEIARRLQAFPHRERLLAALRDCERTTQVPNQRQQLELIASAVDPDPDSLGNHWRKALQAKPHDLDALKKLAKEATDSGLPAAFLVSMSLDLRSDDAETAATLLKEGLRLHPDDFWLNFELAYTLETMKPPQTDEAIRYFTAARTVRGQSAIVHNHLGRALAEKGRMDEAINSYNNALKLDPKYAAAHNNLGHLLLDMERTDAAIISFEKAIGLDPKYAQAHNNLGDALRRKSIACYEKGLMDQANKLMDRAISSFNEAIKLDDHFAEAYFNLGDALRDKGMDLGDQGLIDNAIDHYRKAAKIDPTFVRPYNNLGDLYSKLSRKAEAITAFRKAIEVKPNNSQAHNNLGVALKESRQFDEAILSFKEAIKLDPVVSLYYSNLGATFLDMNLPDQAIPYFITATVFGPEQPEAYVNLGLALRQKGLFVNAKNAFERGRKWVRPDNARLNALKSLIAETEVLIEQDRDLDAVLKGRLPRPTDWQKNLAFARLSLVYKHTFAAAARFFSDAFTDKPDLLDNPQEIHRFHAAHAAVLAARGQGEDARELGDKERASLRRQALQWLTVDLKAAKNAKPQERAAILGRLAGSLQAPDFAGVRDKDELDKLPENEHRDWQNFWAEVKTLVKPDER